MIKDNNYPDFDEDFRSRWGDVAVDYDENATEIFVKDGSGFMLDDIIQNVKSELPRETMRIVDMVGDKLIVERDWNKKDIRNCGKKDDPLLIIGAEIKNKDKENFSE